MLGSRPTLTPVNFNQEFIVTIDTSKIAHGAILSQKDEKGEERICAYASSLLPDSKINRPAIQLEKEGIRWALQHFRPYLLGREFLIRTDHKPLVSLAKGTVDITDSVSAEIQKYLPFRVEYLPGNKMPADYLSRPVCLTRKIREVQGKRDERSAIGTTTWKSDTQRLSAELIKMAQLSDNVCKALAVFLRYKSYPKNPLLKAQVVSLAPTCKLDSDGLIVNRQSQILIPDSLKGEIIMRSHDEMGHRNADTSLANATQFFFWENMKKDFVHHISGCKVCLQSKPGYGEKKTMLGQFPTPRTFNERIHLDCITNLRRSPVTGHTAILVISDSYSNFVQAESIPSPTAESAVSVLMDKWIKHHGFPRTVVTDSGKEFDNEAFSETCKQYGITHKTTMTAISRTNGQVERANRSLLQFMRAYIEGHKFKIQDWE